MNVLCLLRTCAIMFECCICYTAALGSNAHWKHGTLVPKTVLWTEMQAPCPWCTTLWFATRTPLDDFFLISASPFSPPPFYVLSHVKLFVYFTRIVIHSHTHQSTHIPPPPFCPAQSPFSCPVRTYICIKCPTLFCNLHSLMRGSGLGLNVGPVPNLIRLSICDIINGACHKIQSCESVIILGITCHCVEAKDRDPY